MKYFILSVIVFFSTACTSCPEIAKLVKEEYPDEISVGTLVQISNNQISNGSANGSFMFGFGSYNADYKAEYFYVGLYKDAGGYIKTFKLPAKDVYFVESNDYTISIIGIHEYINYVAYHTFNIDDCKKYVRKFISQSLYVNANDAYEENYGIYSRPKIKICVPMNSIEKYVNITY